MVGKCTTETSHTTLIMLAAYLISALGCQLPQRADREIVFASDQFRQTTIEKGDESPAVTETSIRPVGFFQADDFTPAREIALSPQSGATRGGQSSVPGPYVSQATHLGADRYCLPPLTSDEQLPGEQVHLALDDILQLALSNASIVRSLGGQILTNPSGAAAKYDSAINATDPVFGVDAALSQFDANLSASLNHANNDNVFNNSILGGGATEIVQDLSTADLTWQKIGTAGTRYSLGQNLIYDNNNNPASTFPSSYAGYWEAQMRHPLLQGRGAEFNQIAGPNARPGFYNSNGLVIARINHDVSIAQFEQDIRGYVDALVRSYWELHFAYKNYEASETAADAAHETWRSVKAKYDNDLPGGEADNEAQAREQYYQFQQRLVTALNGDPQSGVTGLLQAEANLRRLLGLPQSDGRLILPADQPATAKTVFDWYSLVDLALNSRVELRQQSWEVKKRELELLASKNFMLPRLDAVATFRNNGFGDNIAGGGGRFASVTQDMASGDHNEWEMGLQFNLPIGFRQAHAGVRNSELKLFREQGVFREQEKQILHDLGTAVRLTQQYYEAMNLASKRVAAAQDMRDARNAKFEADSVSLDLLLEAQQRWVDAQRDFHRAQVNFQIANESIHRETGQLLASHEIFLPMLEAGCAGTGGTRLSETTVDYRY